MHASVCLNSLNLHTTLDIFYGAGHFGSWKKKTKKRSVYNYSMNVLKLEVTVA